MNKELYDKLFARMDELKAIREIPGMYFVGPKQHRCHHPVLSDCLLSGYRAQEIMRNKGGNIPTSHINDISEIWDLDKPFLYDQENVVGDELLALIS